MSLGRLEFTRNTIFKFAIFLDKISQHHSKSVKSRGRVAAFRLVFATNIENLIFRFLAKRGPNANEQICGF